MRNTPYHFGVMGSPVRHSLSPRMHQYWLKTFGIDGLYEAFETDGSEQDFLQKFQICCDKGVTGFNITIPHKLHAHALCDHLGEEAKMVESVNTLTVKKGRIYGDNTDILGFIQNIKRHKAYKIAKKTQNVVIIGAGGTTRSVLYALLCEGFQTLHIVNRTVEKAQELKDYFHASYPEASIEVYSFERLQSCLNDQPEHSLVVNTSSLGMMGQGTWTLEFPRHFYVTDVIYSPITTPFLHCAEKLGLPYQDGFGMLMYQGARSFEIWTGKKPKVDFALREYLLAGRSCTS